MNTKTPVIQIDVDGVLADFTTAFRREARRHDPTISLVHTEWPFTDIPKSIVNAVWKTIKGTGEWWLGLDGLPTRDEWDQLTFLTIARDVYFVTARPGDNARLATMQWLDNRGLVRPVVIRAEDKAAIAKAIGATHSLEDKPLNAVEIAWKGVDSYLLDQPWNRVPMAAIVTRVPTLGAFLAEVL